MHTVFIGLMTEHARVEIDTDVLLKNVGKPELVAFNYFCIRYVNISIDMLSSFICTIDIIVDRLYKLCVLI